MGNVCVAPPAMTFASRKSRVVRITLEEKMPKVGDLFLKLLVAACTKSSSYNSKVVCNTLRLGLLVLKSPDLVLQRLERNDHGCCQSEQ
jgi:hypothetical protein